MSRKTIIFTNEDTKVFSANPRQLAGYQATIQNNTTQIVTITVTNEGRDVIAPTFAAPASGVLTVGVGAIEGLTEPYQRWNLVAAAPTTGTVDITEMG